MSYACVTYQINWLTVVWFYPLSYSCSSHLRITAQNFTSELALSLFLPAEMTTRTNKQTNEERQKNHSRWVQLMYVIDSGASSDKPCLSHSTVADIICWID